MKNKKLQSKQKASKTPKLTKLSVNELNQVNGGWWRMDTQKKLSKWEKIGFTGSW